MSNTTSCRCARCTVRSLRGPVIIVTVGILFLLQELLGGFFDFSNTYPVIIIVIGLLSLAGALASSEGHLADSAAPPAQVPAAAGAPPAANAAPGSYSGQGQ